MTKKRLMPAGLTVLLVLGLRVTIGQSFVINSIPGQIPISDPNRLALLESTIERIEPVDDSVREQVLLEFANRETAVHAFDDRSGGTHLSQIILANLALGRSIEESNRLLKNLVVWGNAGSSWPGNPEGDYDFGLIWLTRILYEFGDDETVLFPQSRDWLLNTLLTEHGRLDLMVPATGGLVFDTENHLLMREGSRYLKNQWLKAQGSVPVDLDNDENGLGIWLEGYLNHIRLKGSYEFNSIPYVVYCMLPLLNLADYAESQTIRRLAESILDNIAMRFDYGSFHLRQCAPFRRQSQYAEDPSLLISRYLHYAEFQLDPNTNHDKLLILASVLHDYTLPQETYNRLVSRSEREYYAIFAHEQGGGPEIYSGAEHFLLTAGGSYQGSGAKVIVRPIALLINETAQTLADCFHIAGEGSWEQWNMTGVHRRFAVARGSVVVPARHARGIGAGWNVVKINNNITVAFYQGGDLALLLVLPAFEGTRDEVTTLLEGQNPALDTSGKFHWPAAFAPNQVQTIEFDIDADPATWVITAVDGALPAPMETTGFEEWPFVMIDETEEIDSWDGKDGDAHHIN